MKTKNKEKLVYFPSVKNTFKLGMIVSGTAVVISGLITGINFGMTWIMSII